ncbi:MAG: phosphoribosylformylglycinamidine synthase subunit PurQ [Candidatus Wallbacteria bacterium]|nr:phosphoribosylformylglycinamidine synthase subunit PurQ [Candidatus Wallbacteria bacterium]
MKAAVILFPGSNCERDTYYALEQMGFEPYYLWHRSEKMEDRTVLAVLPGGFSFGDYLRTGAIACHSPVMKAVRKFSAGGGLVLGICNGFQILTESGLLPGVLQINTSLQFHCHDVFLTCENSETPFTSGVKGTLKLPIAHYEGNYFIEKKDFPGLTKNNQIAFSYATPEGKKSRRFNPNGSISDIAGVMNREKNILGMMPHPERAIEQILGGSDGSMIFRSLFASLKKGGRKK